MATGTYAGRRASYVYTDDTGQQYVITTSKILGDQQDNGLTPYDPKNPGNVKTPPKRFKFRHVWWQSYGGPYTARKRLICGTSKCPFYKQISATYLKIDGQDGNIVGRGGEQFTYPSTGQY